MSRRVSETVADKARPTPPDADGDVSHLTALLHPTPLGIWEECYDDDGVFDEERLLAAIRRAEGGSAPDDVFYECDDSEDEMPDDAGRAEMDM